MVPVGRQLRNDPGFMDQLQSVTIFSNAAAVTLARLGMVSKRRNFVAGESIILRGEDKGAVLLLLQGEVKAGAAAANGREVVFRRIRQGEVIGDYAAIDGRDRTADVVACSDVSVALISRQEFLHLIFSDPAVSQAQMLSLVTNLRELSERVVSMTAQKANIRLVGLLLKMSQSNNGGQLVVKDLPTHAELAALISSQRHVVTAEFGRLEKRDLIQKHGRDLLLLDRVELEKIWDSAPI